VGWKWLACSRRRRGLRWGDVEEFCPVGAVLGVADLVDDGKSEDQDAAGGETGERDACADGSAAEYDAAEAYAGDNEWDFEDAEAKAGPEFFLWCVGDGDDVGAVEGCVGGVVLAGAGDLGGVDAAEAA